MLHAQAPDGIWRMGAVYDLGLNHATTFHIYRAPFCGASSMLPDGDVVHVSGDVPYVNTPSMVDGKKAVQIYSPGHPLRTRVVANMARGRWYPSVMMLANGSSFIVGGTQVGTAHILTKP